MMFIVFIHKYYKVFHPKTLNQRERKRQSFNALKAGNTERMKRVDLVHQTEGTTMAYIICQVLRRLFNLKKHYLILEIRRADSRTG